ncbi:helix-turn-helix domain-containing protein [Oceanicola sp. 502str15]|uniref:helix-turn-helix domain-containing protein n=1 Tax=Oceanicola sp. 502str15 TaxID=2696061 RepID=UPI0020952094|nr:helix-turn-helix transcriptional regulator [Oceanicola sp. 502str15]MCO6384884.1 helix-turn-helix domain-containing protein [Oceanicola sp. 502str15]
MSIGEKLFSLRQKTGESLQQVANAVEVSKAHVWELEKGRSRNPSFELVRKLADHYGVSIDVLTGQASEPNRDELQVDRIHRDLGSLSERDRGIIEQMIETMKSSEPKVP